MHHYIQFIYWDRILLFEIASITLVMLGLGLIKAPRFLVRRKLATGYPWGYYADQIPKKDPGFYDENSEDFLHDTGTGFGVLEGFGEYGEFSGVGELGEFGNSFFAGDAGGGGDVHG